MTTTAARILETARPWNAGALLILPWIVLATPVQAGHTDPDVVTTVPVGSAPAGMGVNPNTNRIYVANLASNTVSVIDGATDTVIATIGVGSAPQGVAVNACTNRVYVVNVNSQSLSVIDGAANTLITTIPGLASKPRFVATNPNTNLVYVSENGNGAGNTVAVISGVTNTIVATIAVTPSPSGIAVNPTTNRIYVVHELDDLLSVIDGATNTVITTVPVGDQPQDVSVNPSTNRIYVSNFLGDTVSVIDGVTSTSITTVPVGAGPRGTAVNSVTNRIYCTLFTDDAVAVLDLFTHAITATVPVGNAPTFAVANPITDRIHVSNFGGATVSVIADSAQCVDPPSGLVAWWPGDNHTADIAGSHGGTLLNGATYTPGHVGAAFLFDGVDDGLFIPDSPAFDLTDFTLDAWIKTPDAGSGRRRIICQQPTPGAYWVLALNDNRLEICSALDFGCLQAGPALNDDMFHHVAGVREANVAMRWYIDGALVLTTAISNPAGYALVDDVYIGRLTPLVAVPEFFNGIIDEVQVFDRALSTAEIKAIFDAGKAGKCKAVNYCTAGTSAGGCTAQISANGTPSATAVSGFTLSAVTVEGKKDGLFFFGTNGRQANTWGSGTSYQCVVPPVKRAGLLSGVGTPGWCDGFFWQDLNALWCPTCPKPAKNPGAGAVVRAQLWYRDPFNTSNQTTSLSAAIEFVVTP